MLFIRFCARRVWPSITGRTICRLLLCICTSHRILHEWVYFASDVLLSDKLSEKLSEIIKARCVRLLAPFANEVLGCQVQLLQSRLNESKSELKHLRGEIDNARKAEADLHKVVVEIHDRAQVATQHLEAEKTKLQAALDRVNGERVRLAYDLANMKRQADCSMQLPVVHPLAKSDCISFQRMTRTAPPA
jgi:predicted component of type VI protein secretion system